MSVSLKAQNKYGYQWIFLAEDYMDFRTTPPKISTIEPQPFYSAGEFGTTMCDKYGELIFQAGGCFILNKKFETIQNYLFYLRLNYMKNKTKLFNKNKNI